MNFIGNEACGGDATYGQDGDDYSTARDFVIKQMYNMNDVRKYTELLEYYPGNIYGHRTFEDMINDFEEFWKVPDDIFWQDIASSCFDGHEEKDE